MPDVDRLLKQESARWQERVDANSQTARLTTAPPRQRAQRHQAPRTSIWAAALVGAALVAGALALVLQSGNDAVTNDHASCVAPYLTTTPNTGPADPGHVPTLGDLRVGDHATVYGHAYFAGQCNDVGANGNVPTPLDAASSVTLRLVTSDHRTATSVAVHPDAEGSFTSTLTIPASAPPGSATITDGAGHAVNLVIKP